MSDLPALYLAYAVSFTGIVLYLAHLWLESRKLERERKRIGLVADGDEAER